MKKVLTMTMIAMSSMVMAQEVDNRPASQKAQDVYVEPTLRMTTTFETTVQDPVTAEKKVLDTQNSTKVYNHSGQMIKKEGIDPTEMKREPEKTSMNSSEKTSSMTAPKAAPVKKAVHKEITDMSRPMQ